MHTPGLPVNLSRGHEGRALFVARQNELDRGVTQTLDNVQILFTRYAEDSINALVFECCNQQIGTLGHFSHSRFIRIRFR
jgi:hypothetical protein